MVFLFATVPAECLSSCLRIGSSGQLCDRRWRRLHGGPYDSSHSQQSNSGVSRRIAWHKTWRDLQHYCRHSSRYQRNNCSYSQYQFHGHDLRYRCHSSGLLFLPNRQLAIWHPAAVHRLSAKSSKRRCLVPASTRELGFSCPPLTAVSTVPPTVPSGKLIASITPLIGDLSRQR